MFEICIDAMELFDENTEEFVNLKAQKLQLEHSLASISKWEAKWKKPFLSKENKTVEETRDYVKCMTITQNVDSRIYDYIPNEKINEIKKYIEEPMTATIIKDHNNGPKNREILTSEIIYYMMVDLNIPFECQKWHLNRLLTLINVCNIKHAPAKKMGKRELMSRNAALNAERKRQLNTKG